MKDGKLNLQTITHVLPPKPGLIAKSWSSIRSSCSDLISKDLVLSSFFILRSTRLRTKETKSQLVWNPFLWRHPLFLTKTHS